jgi:hypothetical protein
MLKDRARVHPFGGNGGSWREADIRQTAQVLTEQQPVLNVARVSF